MSEPEHVQRLLVVRHALVVVDEARDDALDRLAQQGHDPQLAPLGLELARDVLQLVLDHVLQPGGAWSGLGLGLG